MIGLDIAYLRTKFDDCSFSRSRDMVGAHQNINGSRDLTTTLSGMIVICGIGLAMISLRTKFDVHITTHYGKVKMDTKCGKWGGLG